MGTVLDCFAGSGSTLIAARDEGFNFIGIEQSEEYCQIARDRLNAIETTVPVAEAKAKNDQLPLFAKK